MATDYAVTYADFPVPQPRELTTLSDGVFWLRMPLPFELDHINLYLLEDSDGWLIVDTGVGGDITREHWEAIFTSHLGDKPVKGIIVTHMHPDHFGQAGYLSDRWRAPLLMSFAEYAMGRALSAPPSQAGQWPAEDYYRRAGLNSEQIESRKNYDGGFASLMEPVPRAFKRLQHGQSLDINDHRWQVMIGRGHSPEHVSLYCEDLQILISGDHILPAITPNISVFAIEPENNPLADYLDTLPQFAELPAETLVLPAHNRPFTGLHQRVAYMRDHHMQKLDALLQSCQEPQTALALVPAMFKRKLDQQQMMFALGECLSHLNYLLAQDKIERTESETGAYLYRAKVKVGPCADVDDEEDLALQV